MDTVRTQTRETENESGWQDAFLAKLPKIESQLSYAFRHLPPAEEREEAMQEGVANCLVRYEQLVRHRRTGVATHSSLAQFGIRQIRCGRTVATRLNIHEPLSAYAKLRKGIRVKRLDQCSREGDQWIEAVVEDRRAPIPEQVALRLDLRSWFGGLARRTRLIARDMALGWRTGELARKYRLSPARISQLRGELYDSWRTFQGLTLDRAGA